MAEGCIAILGLRKVHWGDRCPTHFSNEPGRAEGVTVVRSDSMKETSMMKQWLVTPVGNVAHGGDENF